MFYCLPITMFLLKLVVHFLILKLIFGQRMRQYICSKTGDEACNNNNMGIPIKKRCIGRGYYCCMPSSPVLLHIFSTFCTVIPTSFNTLMEILVSLVFRCILACKYNTLYLCASPTHFAARHYNNRARSK